MSLALVTPENNGAEKSAMASIARRAVMARLGQFKNKSGDDDRADSPGE
jgi:hypothetical protein